MGYIGFRLGLSTEIVKLLGLTVGFFVSFGTYQAAGDLIAERSPVSVEWASALALAFITAGVTLGLTWGIRFFQALVEVKFQETLGKVGGLLAGILRAGLVVSVFLVMCRQLPSAYLEASIEERSMSGKALSRLAPAVYDAAVPRMNRFVQALRGKTE